MTSCSQAIEKLVQTRAKSNFVDKVTQLFQHSTDSKNCQLKDVWRWVKYLPGQVVQLRGDLRDICSAAGCKSLKEFQWSLQQMQNEARLMKLVKDSGIFGGSGRQIEETVHRYMVEQVRKNIQLSHQPLEYDPKAPLVSRLLAANEQSSEVM